MDSTQPATGGATAGRQGDPKADSTVLMSSKPLHRFLQREPKSLGIVMLICGCAEILMGFHLASEVVHTSYTLYIPFWQGALFLLCGNLSIYTERHPSKKMVTVCLSMYLVSFFGILFSFGYRISCFTNIPYLKYRPLLYGDMWNTYRADQLGVVEGVLFASSLCVAGLLIFLSCVARLALKSTNTQVIVQLMPPAPQSDAATN